MDLLAFMLRLLSAPRVRSLCTCLSDCIPSVVCWRCLFCLAMLSFAGVSCRAWRCLPCCHRFFSLALLGVTYIAWCYLALLRFVGVARLVRHCSTLLRVACLPWRCLASATGFADSSCTLLVANALSVLCLPGLCTQVGQWWWSGGGWIFSSVFR